MVSFFVYDIVFLILFGILAGWFFYRNKKNVKRHGWIFLYHSKVGIKFIEWTAKKFERILKPLSYVVIASGYALMAGILWLLTKTVWVYVTQPIPTELQGLPPIAPLIPYFPKIFNLESLFPPLYFTYFLIALAIVAVSHEFSHGIFARLWKIKVKTTGLAFFGPFFGAFVEPDEKQMEKSGKFKQLSILGAGTFANMVMTILFGLIMWGFFALSFAPAGLEFNTYAQTIVNVSSITMIGNVTLETIGEIPSFAEEGLNRITLDSGEIVLIPNGLLTEEVLLNNEQIVGFENSPAINSRLEGAIKKIGDYEVKSHKDLINALENYSPNEQVKIITIQSSGEVVYDVILGDKNGKAYLGVGFYSQERGGFSGKIYSIFSKVKQPNVYYEATWDGDFVVFIYDLLWWIIVINILVALMNMLPVSILDGGRFFYITIWGITGKEKIGKKAYAIVTWFILLLVVLMMAKWFLNLF
ncbi:MAG: site-2 protease family protein [Candidatus Pacearchaeota archaeon]|nr:site-2 protease family protein [Candidatus Pacearchaeota archaeon]